MSSEDTERPRGSEGLVARTTGWLTEVGAWIFGGLLALNLVLTASLLDVDRQTRRSSSRSVLSAAPCP